MISSQMQKLVERVLRFRLYDEARITKDYVDQTPIHGIGFFSTYGILGVLSIETAFILRMENHYPWDSRELICREVIENSNLHINVKRNLQAIFDETDWARWYDGYYCRHILEPQPNVSREQLRIRIQEDPYLEEKSRENLLYNLDNRKE